MIVGQSYRAFTATLPASQLPALLLMLLAGMIPARGESPGQCWDNTGYRQAAERQAKPDGWLDVPTKFILCKADQFFPRRLLRRLAQDRLASIPD